MADQEMRSEKKRSILVVEDDPGLSELIIRKLKRHGCDAIGISKGIEALEWVAQNPPAVMLIDQRLPDMTGRDVVATLVERGGCPPFIMMTGQGDERLAVEIMKLGAFDYLIKDPDLMDRLPHVMERVFHAIEIERNLKEAQQYLRKFSLVVEQSPVSVVITDLDAVIEYVNRKCAQITGYAPEELIGKNPRILQSGEHPPSFYQELWKTLDTQQEWRGQFHNRKKNGESYWESALISSIVDEQGKKIGYLGIKEDITDRKKAQEELVAAKEKAEESVLLKSAFLRNFSHEIRTPLNAIVGFSELLSDPTLPPESRKEFSEIVIEKSFHLTSVIDDVLTLSSLETRQEGLENVTFDVRAMIGERLCVAREKAEKKGLRVVEKGIREGDGVEMPEDRIVYGDMRKVARVVSLLLDNAIKYTDVGEIELTCDIKKDMIWVSVKDTGIGIEKSKHAAIFESFVQVDLSERRTYGGAGLGLSICKSLVELMGGTIGLVSQPGIGSTFFFSIPKQSP